MTQETTKIPIVPPAQTRPGPPSSGPGAKKRGTKGKKIANSLVALSSAAIVSVYGLGYARTQSAAAHFTTDIAAESTPVAVATVAPAATATLSPSPAPAIQFPFLGPTATVVTPTTGISAQRIATPTTASSTPTVPAATATATATATASATAGTTATRYKDGTYTGIGSSRHGSIGATVVIQGGKIVSAEITQCGTRYPCSKIASLPQQVVTRQSATVDLVSGATDSSEAYQGAITSALAKASAAG